ncbi:MAG: VOC family protein [Myxococcales bacterium]|nr:VOC family protein [Myxococcales bacterium]
MPPPPEKGKKAKKVKKPKKGAPPPWKEIAGTPAADPTPEPYHTVTVALVVDDANAALGFYEQAFGATRGEVMPGPAGKIAHAELTIGDSILMLSDEYPEMGSKSAKTLGGSAVALHMYVEDVDAAFAKASEAGASAAMPVTDMFWGDRYGALVDGAGFMWGVATHKEDLTPEQMQERMAAQAPAGAPAGDAAAEPAPAG